MQNDMVIKITTLKKVYENGFKALNGINLEISRGEIFALLGPNGAGKTTLISTVCGIVRPTSGTVAIGVGNIRQYRQAQSLVGLVPQGYHGCISHRVETVAFSRGLFGRRLILST